MTPRDEDALLSLVRSLRALYAKEQGDTWADVPFEVWLRQRLEGLFK